MPCYGYFLGVLQSCGHSISRKGELRRQQKKQGSNWTSTSRHFFPTLSSLLVTALLRWSWKRTWTPCCCSSSTSWCGSTPSSPFYLPTSLAGCPDLTGASTAQRRREPREPKLVRSWDNQRDHTEQWAPWRSWSHLCIQEWTHWIRCSSMQPWGSPTETALGQERWLARKMSDKATGRCSRR